MALIVLCYHKVGTEEKEGRRLNVHPRRLDSHVRFFLRRRYAFARGRDLAGGVTGRTVCFTFDDGFVSTLENGQPVFDRHGLPMTIYAVSDRVGETSLWEDELARPLATWERLKEAEDAGHEIGNHTATHPRLGLMSFEDQLAELVRCREALAAQGFQPGSFCYPYGSLNGDSRRAVREAGYSVGMALGKRAVRPGDPIEALPRIVMAYGDGLPLLIYKLSIRPHLKK
ncbi:MAG: polysaccharide deacetylase family protein [Armatimonadetes bacterium]|nr:polysaccharide deacetylase family protein [Armatimonadota bacterium]